MMFGTLTLFSPVAGPLGDGQVRTAAGSRRGIHRRHHQRPLVLLIGGNRGGRPQWPRVVLEYDLASNRWTTKKPVPFSGDHMAAAESGGKIYVFGGQAEGGVNKPLNTAWEYDPAADSWKALAPIPPAGPRRLP